MFLRPKWYNFLIVSLTVERAYRTGFNLSSFQMIWRPNSKKILNNNPSTGPGNFQMAKNSSPSSKNLNSWILETPFYLDKKKILNVVIKKAKTRFYYYNNAINIFEKKKENGFKTSKFMSKVLFQNFITFKISVNELSLYKITLFYL